MPEVTSSQPNLSCGELSPIALGRYDLSKYNNGLKKMENFLINQLGGAFFRSGTRYVADCKYSDRKSRVFPFQYSTEDDYVVEMGDEYMKFYLNGVLTSGTTTSLDSLLCNLNGPDGSLEIVDSGNTGHIVTKVGTAQTSTAQKKFGLTSILLDGNSDYLSVPNHTDFDFGAGDFTIEFWVYFNSIPALTRIFSLGEYNDGGIGCIYTAGSLDLYITDATRRAFAWTPVVDTWYHFAIVKEAGNYRVCINGTQIGATLANAANININDASSFGTWTTILSDYLDGYIDEIRISNIARYVSTAIPFTPATSAFTSDADTKLLIHCNSLDVAKGNPLTFVGTAQLDTEGLTTRKFNNCLWTDGNSDYLTSADHADWDLVASAVDSWTIDFWVHHTTHAATDCYINQFEDANNKWEIQHVHGTGLQFIVTSGGVTIITTGAPTGGEITDSDWHHIALCKVVDEYGLYLDGVQVAYVQDASTDTFAGVLEIARSGAGANYFEGFMDEVRICVSNEFTAAPNVGLTDTITIPTAAHTLAAAGLLMHFDTPYFLTDNSLTGHAVTKAGTARQSPAKFGDASILLDGNSDYVSIPDSDSWNFGTDAFTIDLWTRFNSVAADNGIMGQSTDANNFWTLFWDQGTNRLRFYNYLAAAVTIDFYCSFTPVVNTWYHIALVRVDNGNTSASWRLFINGVSYALTLAGGNWNSTISNYTGALLCGYSYNDAPTLVYFNGWLDDVRIDKGTARYTIDFTPPTTEASSSTVIVSEIASPYMEEDIFDVHYAQSNDVMYLTHPDYHPRKLIRTDATTFALSLVDFKRGPFLDSNLTTTTITPSAQTGAGITLTASAELFDALHVGSLWRINSAATTGGIVKITAFTSSTVVTGNVQTEPDGSAGDIGGVGAYTDWAEGAFSAFRGYPATVTFHEQRLYYASTTDEPQKFWGSTIQAFDNFDTGNHTGTGTPAQDDALTFEISTEQRNNIRWMTSGAKSLILGTSGGTFSVYTGNANEPISNDNVLVSRDTNYGVANLRPSRLSSYVYYIQRDLNKMRELKYSFQVDGITSDDMTLLAEHILRDGEGAKEFYHQQSPNDRMWTVRNDGTMSVLTRNPEQDVMGWSRIIAGLDSSGNGEFESVCVIPKENQDDQVWVVVRRMIGGTEKRFIEFFTSENFVEDWDAIRLDSSLTYDVPKIITGITNASPGVVTIATHGFITGDQIKIYGVEGMTIDGEYLVVWIDANTFSLTTIAGVAVDTTLLGTYLEGGEAWKMVTNLSGLTHLEGEQVVVTADGYSDGTLYTVVSGAITLPDKAAVVHVGLPYEGTIQMLKLSDGSALGTGQTKTRRIYLSAIRVDRTQGLWIGRSLTTLDEIFYDDTSLFTGDIHKLFQTSWGKGDEIIIRQISPNPAHILALIMSSEVTD